MIDKYFRYTILIDILLCVIVIGLCHVLFSLDILTKPEEDSLLSITSDISNVAFTSAGFVLTFLTLLVSFKISIKPIKRIKRTTLEDTYKKAPLFDLFLNSELYKETIKHLKVGIKELIIIAVTGYSLKLFSSNINQLILFYFNVIGIITTALVLYRSLLVLSSVLSVQDKNL